MTKTQVFLFTTKTQNRNYPTTKQQNKTKQDERRIDIHSIQ
jgi:hypothetical protein